MARQNIDSGMTRLPGMSGDTVVTVETGQRPHVSHQDQRARWEMLRGLVEHPEIPVSADMVQRQLLFGALSPEKQAHIRDIEELIGDQVTLPGSKPNPLYAEALRRLEAYENQARRSALLSQSDMANRNRESRFASIRRLNAVIRWIDRVFQPEGGDHFGELK